MSELIVALGFDCDRPRGEFSKTPEGRKLADRKLNSIRKISDTLDKHKISRTFFICGMFLEAMSNLYGNDALATSFRCNAPLVEIADHTYSHQILKKISTRPDKEPIHLTEISKEYHYNSELFNKIFCQDLSKRGYRAPLGHYQGLQDSPAITDALLEIGVTYVSSDLRDSKDSICPELIWSTGRARQPYYYPNGLIEIPSSGWQDTAFSGTTKTKLFLSPPSCYNEIINYYEMLFGEASRIAKEAASPYYIGLVMHPYDVSFYDESGNLFKDLSKILNKLNGSFACYKDIKSIFEKKNINRL